MAGHQDADATTSWYHGLTKGNPMEGIGPGPNTKTFLGYQQVKDMLQRMALRLQSGTLERSNELDMQILRNDMWPETGRSLFGFDSGDHASVRPFLLKLLDGARESESTPCDGSACWNVAWLRRILRQQFAGMDAISSSDIPWLMAIVLHRIHLGMELREQEARHFVAFLDQLLFVANFPRGPSAWEAFLGGFPLDAKQRYLALYQTALGNKWPQERLNESPAKAALLSSAFLDSIALHAVPSLSSAAEHALALLFMHGDPGASLPRPMTPVNVAMIRDLIWETLRRFPPISAVPYWTTDDIGLTWTRKIANVGQALQDPNVFSEPLAVRLGRPGLNHEDSQLSIGFADFATVAGNASHRDAHACPGKNLALAILEAFLREFLVHQWEADSADIKLNSFSTSGFTLRKVSGF